MKEIQRIFLFTSDMLEDYDVVKCSEVVELDPLYIIDTTKLDPNELSKILSCSKNQTVKYCRLENDWVPEFIKTDDYNEIIKEANNDQILSRYYNKEKDASHYNCIIPKVEISEDIRESITSILNNYFKTKWLENFLKFLNKNAGMMFYSRPEDTNEFIESVENCRTHYAQLERLYNNAEPKGFYMGLLNRLDYGISVVSENYDLLYTNYIRRSYHGDMLLGKKCYEVFPYEERNEECPQCPIGSIWDNNTNDNIRCEVHKLRNKKNDVYYVSETSSKYNIYNNKNNKVNKVGINVVRLNTYQILTQEYQNILQRLNKTEDIVTLLKYALLGGLKNDFERDFGLIVKDKDDEIQTIIENISYNDPADGIERMLNFGFGRFRYYNKVTDIFSKHSGFENAPKEAFQIVNSYACKNGNNVECKEVIGKYIYQDDDFYSSIFHELKFTEENKIDDTFNLLLEKLENFTSVDASLKYLDEVGLSKEVDKMNDSDQKIYTYSLAENIRCAEWFDLPLRIGRELLGIISLDWVGKGESFQRLRGEIFANLRELMNFAAHAIRRAEDNKILSITGKFSNLISEVYKAEKDLLYGFCSSLVSALDVLKCEVYYFNDLEDIERTILCYGLLSDEKNKALLELLKKSNHKMGNHMIGNVLSIFNQQLKVNSEEKENFIRCINILNYSNYDKYYSDGKIKNDSKKINSKYKDAEEQLVSSSEYLNYKIELKNCLIVPLIYREKLFGALKVTNCQKEGNIFFSLADQRILDNIAGQLALKIENIRMLDRESEINKIFSNLSNILQMAQKDLGEVKDNDIRDELKGKVFGPLCRLLDPSSMIYFKIKKDEYYCDVFEAEYFVPKEIKGYSLLKTIEYNIIINEIKKISENRFVKNNAWEYFTFSECKKFLWISYTDFVSAAAIYIENIHKAYSEADYVLIKSIAEQIDSILSIRYLKIRTAQIMQNIAHQIISPLAGLEGHCLNLLRSMLPEGHKEHFEYMNDGKKGYVYHLLQSQTTHVRRVADGYQIFLDFDLGKDLNLEYNYFSFYKEVIRIVTIYQYIAKEQGLEGVTVLPSEEKYYIDCNKNFIMNIFSCLIDNAIKYSSKDTLITLRFSKKDFFHKVEVNNKGIIIDENEWEKIFEREYRTTTAKRRNQHGNGIGLYLARKMCECLKGKIYVLESNENKGTTFAVELPVDIKKYK